MIVHDVKMNHVRNIRNEGHLGTQLAEVTV
jgi:hypothetical protein